MVVDALAQVRTDNIHIRDSSGLLTLVSQGGGIGGGAYVVGVMKALKEIGALTYITRTITSSAGTPAVIYPLLGKDRLVEEVWAEQVTGPAVVNRAIRSILRGEPLLNINYLVDEILRNHPFDSIAFHDHMTTMDMSVTAVNRTEGNELKLENVLLSNRDSYDPLLMIKAAIAIPAVYGELVHVGAFSYVDGGITSQLPHHYAGKEAKFVISTEPSDRELRKSPAEEALLLLCERQGRLEQEIKYAIQRRHKLYKEECASLKQRQSDGEIVVYFSPKQPLRAGVLCHRPEIVRLTIQQGYNETMQDYKIVETVLRQLEMKKVG